MARLETVHVPVGYTLTVTTDAVSSGTYTRLGNPGGTVYTPAALAVSSTATVGPFNEPRNYQLYRQAGTIAYSTSFSGEFTSEDEGVYVKFTDLGPQDAIEDLADDADGEAIAATVNALIAALVAAHVLDEFVEE